MSDCYIGEIRAFAGANPPKGWLPCDGRLLQVDQNHALFTLLGTSYGGNGKTTFGLPDLRGRTPVGATSSGGKYNVGVIDGTEHVTLTEAQTPTHTHSLNATGSPGTSGIANSIFAQVSPNGAVAAPNIYGPADRLVAIDSGSITETGGAPHDNMQPFLAVTFMIATRGLFPSRN